MGCDELGAIGGTAAIVGVLGDHGDPAGGPNRPGGGQRTGRKPLGASSIAMTIPIAIFMGPCTCATCVRRAPEVSLIGVALLLLMVVAGGGLTTPGWGAHWFTPVQGHPVVVSDRSRTGRIRAAGVAAAGAARPSVDVHEGRHHRPAGRRHPAGPPGHAGPRSRSSPNPVRDRSLRVCCSFLFITTPGRCLAFPLADRPGTTPKLLEKESQMRLIGYGGMMTESFVAIMALITAAILNQHLYFAINAPGADRQAADTAATYVNGLGLSGTPITAAQITEAATSVGEKSIVSHRRRPDPGVRHGPVLSVFGGSGLKAFWYHFAIMFEALFILTTIDAAPGLPALHAVRRAEASAARCAACTTRGAGGPAHGPAASSPSPPRELNSVDGCHRSARRNQHALPAVRHRQSVARGDRADRGDRRGGSRWACSNGRGFPAFRCCGI